MKKQLLCILLLITHLTLQASWQIPVTNYFPKGYHAGTQNWQIRQQQNGWMYFANNYGLLEYDGNSWNLYGIWNSSVIRSVEIAPDGSIYVGGSNEFGRFTANRFGTLDYTPLSLDIPKEYKIFGEVWNIHYIHDELYFQTRNEIFHINADGKLNVISPHGRIYCSAKIRGGVYVATTNGVYLLTGEQLNALSGSERLQNCEIRSLQPYGNNGILIGTEFDGLFLFDGNSIRPFATDADAFIRTNQLYTMATNGKYIAIGTVLDGVAIVDINGENASYINNINGLQNNTVLSLLFDSEQNLWLGLDQGIDRIVVESPIFNLYGHANFKGSGYHSMILGDRLYIGTNQGVFQNRFPLDPAQRLTDFRLVNGSMGQVWSLDTIGHTLFCSHNRGLFIVNGESFQKVDDRDGFWRVRALGNTGLGIAGSYNGFYLLSDEGGRWHILHKIEGYNATARIFEIDSDNRIWVISDKGVERITLTPDMRNGSCEVLRKYSGARQEYFTICKVDNRLIVTNNTHCQITDNHNELCDSTEFFDRILDGQQLYPAIIQDAHRNIWYLTNEALKVHRFDTIRQIYRPQSTRIRSMTGMLVGGFEHLNVINPQQAIIGSITGFLLGDLEHAIHRQSSHNRPPVIRKMISTNAKDSLIYGTSYPILPEQPRIAHRLNSLRFEIGGGALSDESRQYAYKLEPLENEFSTLSNSNYKEYTNLQEGDYTLYISTLSETTGDIEQSTFSFTILPPWHRSWWAYCLQVLAVCSICVFIYHHIKQRERRKKEKLLVQKDAEMHEKERQFNEEAHQREKEILKLRNERIEFELQSKSQELANVMLNKLNKNGLLEDIKHDLKKVSGDLQSKDTESASRRLVTLQSKLSHNIDQDIDWKQFEENFDIAHQQFLNKLSEKHPELNKSERQLCIYIRMGLLTKEIAPLMNLSVRGVEMLRYRMRKKMGMERSDNLEQYFSSITN